MGKTKTDNQVSLVATLRSHKVMLIGDIQKALGSVSVATAWRRLADIAYRSSYNCNGRYYALHEQTRYDRLGLWSHRDIRFSRDGSLSSTVRRLVQEATAGYTQRELQELLGVRVQNVVAALLKRTELVRERIDGGFVYLHQTPRVRRGQMEQRREQLAAHAQGEQEVSLDAVVEILLVLIRHPESDPAAVARRLRGRSPPVQIEQIRRVFDRYELGGKRGLQKS